MKFSGREDIEAPISHVWQQISDFAVFERQAMRRGADVRRIDNGPVVVGSAWDVAFSFRGKDRRLKAQMITLDAPQALQMKTMSTGIDGLVNIDLVALSPHRTRFAMSIDLSAKSLSARLLLQSLKLAKANLSNRFKKRLGDYAQECEDSFRA